MAFGLKKRLFKKSFVITNVVLGLLIIGLINVPTIIGFFQDEEEVVPQKVMVINQTDDQNYPLSETILDYLNTPFANHTFELVEKDTTIVDTFWENDESDIVMVFTGNLSSPDVDIYSKDESVNGYLIAQVQTLLNDYQGIEFANYNVVEAPGGSKPANGVSDEDRIFIEAIVSMLFLPVFILLILATQFLGVDIIDEKSTKAIETIISSVPAKTHFFSKILSNVFFLIIQAALLLSFSLLGAMIGRLFSSTGLTEEVSLMAELSSRISNWPTLLSFSLLYMIVGTLLFLSLAALIASIANTQEDYQQFQAPLVFLMLGGFYIGIFLPMMGADNIIRVAAYIPLFSTLVAPIAFATGVIALWELILILFIMIVFVVFMLYFIAPVYKVAILSYEETKFFKRIGFYVKKAFSK